MKYNFYMFEIFKKIKYFFLKKQEEKLQQRLKNILKSNYSNGSTKQVFNSGATLIISDKTKQIIEQVKNNISDIVKQTNGDVDKLQEYIKTKTPIYKIKNANKLLNIIKEEEGIIFEKKGFEALFISLITKHLISFKTEPMFIISETPLEKAIFLHNFYRWYSLNSGLSGFDYKTQKLFKNYLIYNNSNFVKKLSLDKIMKLQEAIARDQEATSFVLEYLRKTEGSQKVLNKLNTEGSAKI